jgi:hypothetical protein
VLVSNRCNRAIKHVEDAHWIRGQTLFTKGAYPNNVAI